MDVGVCEFADHKRNLIFAADSPVEKHKVRRQSEVQQ